jgi:hypothetical protein
MAMVMAMVMTVVMAVVMAFHEYLRCAVICAPVLQLPPLLCHMCTCGAHTPIITYPTPGPCQQRHFPLCIVASCRSHAIVSAAHCCPLLPCSWSSRMPAGRCVVPS